MSAKFWGLSTEQDFQNYHGPKSSNYWSSHSYQVNNDFEQQHQVPYLEHPADQWCSSPQHIYNRWNNPRTHHSPQFQQPMFHQQWEDPRSSYFHQEEDPWSVYSSQDHTYQAPFLDRQMPSIQDSNINSDPSFCSSMQSQDLCSFLTEMRQLRLDVKQSQEEWIKSCVEAFSTLDKIDNSMEEIKSQIVQITSDLNELIAQGLEDEEGEGIKDAYQPDSDTEQQTAIHFKVIIIGKT